MRCMQCNNEVDDRYNFCSYCGAPLAKGDVVGPPNGNYQTPVYTNPVPPTKDSTAVKVLKIIGGTILGIIILYFVIFLIAFGICFFVILGLS